MAKGVNGMIGNELYNKIISYDYGNDELKSLMKKIWQGTPYVVNAYFGDFDEKNDRAEKIRYWCVKNFGERNDFLRGISGNWTEGNVTILGYNWIGFKTKEQLDKFIEVWGD